MKAKKIESTGGRNAPSARAERKEVNSLLRTKRCARHSPKGERVKGGWVERGALYA